MSKEVAIRVYSPIARVEILYINSGNTYDTLLLRIIKRI